MGRVLYFRGQSIICIFQLAIKKTFNIFQKRLSNKRMNPILFADEKAQELNLLFTFEKKQNTYIITTQLEDTTYQAETTLYHDINFDEVQSSLQARQYHLLSKSHDMLKIKVGFLTLQFKNQDKLTLKELKKTVTDLTTKLATQEKFTETLKKEMKLMQQKMDQHKKNLEIEKQERMKFMKEFQIKKNKLMESNPGKSNLFLFSQKYKSEQFRIFNQNRQIHKTRNSYQFQDKFAFVDRLVMKKGSFIRFKVEKLVAWMALGLGIRNIIAGNSYGFARSDKPGHGSFLLSNGQHSYSHSCEKNNNVKVNFSFSQGDIVRVATNETELIFTNEMKNNQTYCLPIQLTENEWKQAFFCVNAGCLGNTVSIV